MGTSMAILTGRRPRDLLQSAASHEAAGEDFEDF